MQLSSQIGSRDTLHTQSSQATVSSSLTPLRNLSYFITHDQKYLLAAETKCTSKSYDYIIAGGGLAGCVLAERLTSDGKSKVLMLEAGRSDYNTFFIRIPAGILRLFRSVYDWQYETSGEEDCEGRNIYLQRGMVS